MHVMFFITLKRLSYSVAYQGDSYYLSFLFVLVIFVLIKLYLKTSFSTHTIESG